MRYLVTGHTGFKGSWLTLLLKSLGHDVSGFALDPLPGGLFERGRLHELMDQDFRLDIRDSEDVKAAVQECNPDVVIHMAAQPLVRASYVDPRYTFDVNVMGTLNVLEAVSLAPSVRAHLVVTTDKVYRNPDSESPRRFNEDDSLGGVDPYSASKSMADLLANSWCSSFDTPPTASARAGNVIGGGDVSPDRLLVDVMNCAIAGEVPTLRFPEAVRPWQHVLDCLAGYLRLVDHLLAQGPPVPFSSWNFGPDPDSFATVADVVSLTQRIWGVPQGWHTEGTGQPHEAATLTLDSQKAFTRLGWRNQLSLEDAVWWTVDWQRRVLVFGEDAALVTHEQVDRFLAS